MTIDGLNGVTRRRRLALRAPCSGRAGAALLAFLFTFIPLAPAQAQNLQLSLSAQPPRSGVVSTVRAEAYTFLVSSGRTLRFARAQGRETRLRRGGGFLWTQVEEVPREGERLELAPRLLDDGRIEVALSVARKDGDRLQSFETVLTAQPGEWIRLYGPSAVGSRGTRSYSTRSVSGEALYLRADPESAY
ncbi:MAG: hypothetical protein V2I82_09545 [Halieaceae bacterium]|jgi:hypothetical protein|nr:hypothetical protein [Halieaceae bacterium]